MFPAARVRQIKPCDGDNAAPRTGHSDFDWVWDKDEPAPREGRLG